MEIVGTGYSSYVVEAKTIFGRKPSIYYNFSRVYFVVEF